MFLEVLHPHHLHHQSPTFPPLHAARLQAWQPDVSCALGTQQPGSGVSHNLAQTTAHYWSMTPLQCHFLVCLGRASSIGLVSSTFYIKTAQCLVPASFRLPSLLPDQLAMHPQRTKPTPSGAPTLGATNASQTHQQLSDGGGGGYHHHEKPRGCARLRTSDAIACSPPGTA